MKKWYNFYSPFLHVDLRGNLYFFIKWIVNLIILLKIIPLNILNDGSRMNLIRTVLICVYSERFSNYKHLLLILTKMVNLIVSIVIFIR